VRARPQPSRQPLRWLVALLLTTGVAPGWALEYAELLGRYVVAGEAAQADDAEAAARRDPRAPIARLEASTTIVLHQDHIEGDLGRMAIGAATSRGDTVELRLFASVKGNTGRYLGAIRLRRDNDCVVITEMGVEPPDQPRSVVLRRSGSAQADNAGDDAQAGAIAPERSDPLDSIPFIGLWGGSWWAVIVLAMQGLCLLHLIRTRGDFRWLYAIIFLPVAGSLVYLFWHRALPLRLPSARLLALPMLERFDLGRVEKAFRHSDTLANRIAFAEALLARGRHDEALALYERALSGPQRNDVTLLFGHAKACYAAGRHRDAAETLLRAEQVPNNEKQRQRHLLLALCLHRLGDLAAAEERFRAAQGGFSGEEARCRYALFLDDCGRSDEARREFAKVVDSAEHSVWSYRRAEAFWIKTARVRLQALAVNGPA